MILALDLSLTSSGCVIMNSNGVLYKAQTLPLDRKAKGSHRLLGLQDNLLSNYYEIIELGMDFDLAVLEDLPKNAMGAGLTAQAHGIARAFLVGKGIPYVTVAPATLKKAATLSGRADKGDMRLAAEKADPDQADWLKNNDEVDAWWLAQVGLHYMNRSNNLLFTENLKDKIKEGT